MAGKQTKGTFKIDPPDGLVTYFQPVSATAAQTAARAEHIRMVVNGTSNFVTVAMQNDVPGPVPGS